MKIYRDEDGLGQCLVSNATTESALLDEVKQTSASCVRFSESLGWKGSDLTFLKSLQHLGLASIEIYSQRIKDLSALQIFPDLKKVGLETKSLAGFESSFFCQLEVLGVRCSGVDFLEDLPKTLRKLHLDAFPGSDLKSIPPTGAIRVFEVAGKKLQNVDGISEFGPISEMALYDLGACTDFSCLEKVNSLKVLELTGATKLTGLDFVQSLDLKELKLDNCGSLETLRPFVNLGSLEVLALEGNTVVQDGDLSILKRLPKLKTLILQPRKHYSHSRQDILSSISDP